MESFFGFEQEWAEVIFLVIVSYFNSNQIDTSMTMKYPLLGNFARKKVENLNFALFAQVFFVVLLVI